VKFLFWSIYFPLLKFISLFIFWLPEFRERKKFELKNETDPLAKSFKEKQLMADIAFEFSSEGEYQQVAGLIDDALKMGKKIELIFFSPSVEKTIQELAKSSPLQLRILRFPLVSINPLSNALCFSRWTTAKRLVLVRYDFFPEFLSWYQKKHHELILLSATFKKERLKNKSPSFIKKMFFSRASKIFYASDLDQDYGKAKGFDGSSFDFRLDQIQRRVQSKNNKFKNSFPEYENLKNNLERYPKEKRLLLGNVWPSDLFLFESIPKDFFVLIIPHKLESEIVREFEIKIREWHRKPNKIYDQEQIIEDNTLMLVRKGLLCELYADFGFAYVGGGFEAGVHSLLEPLVSGCEHISCGTLIHRSTEFDLAQAYRGVTILKQSDHFLDWIEQTHISGVELKINTIVEKYEAFKREILLC